MIRASLFLRSSALLLVVAGLTAASALCLQAWLDEPLWAGALAIAVMVPIALALARTQVAPMISLFRALTATVGSYRDGDFNFSLSWRRRDELRELVEAHNALGDALREQRLSLVERELLLDTMVQHTPVAMLLLDASQRVVYANVAARRLLGDGRRLEGQSLPALLDRAASAFREAVDRGGDGLFAVRPDERAGGEGDDETYHLARRRFRLSGRPHELFLLRRLTTELRRQEVATWKNVIRVISHELNNSLAPIASLAHSGRKLLDQGRANELGVALTTIEERARHLDQFIRGYARFAKLPAPQLDEVAWPTFLDRLRSQVSFGVCGPLPEGPARFDEAQLEQALLNLLKNAHESGSAPDEVTLSVRSSPGEVRIEVEDRGSGMSDAVLASALLPFYSTKRGGTGLGLALAREIAEAHGGRLSIARRQGGGTLVALTVPNE
jgi:two-component system, NtrC family, nitrogen regulation sensor histidine kinase NtrY